MKRVTIIMLGLILLTSCVCSAGSGRADEETEMFLGAKQYVFQGNWKGARYGLERYLESYPSGRFEAEAYYWLALSMNQLAGKVKQNNLMIVMYKRAVEYLDTLLQNHPGSVWEDDANELRVEIAATLALMGQLKYQAYIEELVAGKGDIEEDLLLTALEKISELEPSTALPILEGVLRNQKDNKIRIKAVYIIGAYHGEEALPLLQTIELSDEDENVRNEAALWRKRIEMAAIPSQLNYYCYTAQISGDGDRLIPEDELKAYDFPAMRTRSKRTMKREMNKLFEGKLTNFKFAASATKAAGTAGESQMYPMRTAHNLKGIRVEVPEDGIDKSYFEVRGKASFYSKSQGREHLEEFIVDEDDGRLMMMRHGDHAAILILLFESLEEHADISGEPVYYTKFEKVFGATVHSSRQSWETDELLAWMAGKVVDYGLAKAEIPGKEGRWVLVGDIQLHSKERRFVGRAAVLYDPKRKIAAEAAEIIVPVDDPAGFEISGENKSKS
jgi:hypothetical protein